MAAGVLMRMFHGDSLRAGTIREASKRLVLIFLAKKQTQQKTFGNRVILRSGPVQMPLYIELSEDDTPAACPGLD